jgi:FdhD protein
MIAERQAIGLPFLLRMTEAPPPLVRVEVSAWRGGFAPGARTLPEEVAVALTYDRVTFAVMMASPCDLHDFAVGFSLSERIIDAPAEITDFEVLVLPMGIECRMTLAPDRRDALAARRRRIAGPVGCGLCGIDSLSEAVRPPAAVVSDLVVSPAFIEEALAKLPGLQPLNRESRAVHAAAFAVPGQELIVREDVGRHNALDKLIGAVALSGQSGGAGIVLLTSRVSIELIQKTARLGAGVIVAVSVPSARAVRDAAAAGITLVAVARADGFEVFTGPERLSD